MERNVWIIQLLLLQQLLILPPYNLLHLTVDDAMGEYFMHKGLRVLCVYDDLSKHAVAIANFHYFYVDLQDVKVIQVMSSSYIQDY